MSRRGGIGVVVAAALASVGLAAASLPATAAKKPPRAKPSAATPKEAPIATAKLDALRQVLFDENEGRAVEVANASGIAADPVQDFFLERYAEAYREELATFLNAVRDGKPCNPTGRDGLMAQRLADAATESAQSGKPVRV